MHPVYGTQKPWYHGHFSRQVLPGRRCQSGINPLLSWHLISSYAMDWICPALTVDRNWNLVLSLDNRQMQEGEYPEGQEPNLGILGLWRIGKKLLSGH